MSGVVFAHEATEVDTVPGYNEEMAARILEHLLEVFPAKSESQSLKQILYPESDQREFLTALDALLKLHLIDGKSLNDHNGLAVAMGICITSSGRSILQKRNQPEPVIPKIETTIHGDQIINHGQVGAIGHHASGTVNTYYQCWQQVVQYRSERACNRIGELTI